MIEHYRTALVTGASRGIGAAIARRLARMGLTVHGLARDAGKLEALKQEAGIVPVIADLGDMAATLAALDGLEIDVLVNNAGYVAAVKPLQEMTAADIDNMIAINLGAPMQLMRHVLPGMIARRRGHIFNLGTTAASYVLPGTGPYAAAKAGLSHASRIARFDLVGSGVRVTEISPGRVSTDIYLEAFGGDRDKLRSTLYDTYRAVQPEDVAEALAAAIAMPAHVDLTFIEVSPTDQAPGGHRFAERKTGS